MIWRSEPFVRTALVQVGEADWAFDIGLDLQNGVPVFDHGGAAETFVNVFDTLWTPELKKPKVRQALGHATDCDIIVETFYDGFYDCHDHGAPPGTLGLTPRNSAQYAFDPDLARQLLVEAGYDDANEIIINVFAGRFFRNVEVAEAQAQMWREVGVNAKIPVLATANWLERSGTGCGRSTQYYFVDEGLGFPDTFCVETDPGPSLFGFPHSNQLNPSLEALDLSRFVLSRMDCRGPGSKFCDPVNVQPLFDPCLAATGDDRRVCMTELADIASDQVLMYTYFNAEVFYGVSEDLISSPRYDRRPRVNQWDLN